MQSRFSLLILTHNRLADVQRCFESLQPTLRRGDVQLIVLDNASTDGTDDYVWRATDSTRILSAINLGVAGGRARLLDFARGERIVFLDSDTVIVDHNWLDVLDKALESESVGLVGPGGSFVMPDWSGFTAGRPGEVDCCAGFCQMFKRDLLNYGLRIDETYQGFWTEDSQFCLDIRALGYDVLCVPVGVQHYPAHSGFGQDMTLHDAHIALFRERWQGKSLIKAEGGY